MDEFLDAEVSKHIMLSRQNQSTESKSDKSVIGLAVRNYLTEEAISKRDQQTERAFKSFLKTQTRTIMFAGHDTTSSSICYTYYLLSTNPQALENVRAELNQVFQGKEASSLLAEKPHLIHQIPYTTAAIK